MGNKFTIIVLLCIFILPLALIHATYTDGEGIVHVVALEPGDRYFGLSDVTFQSGVVSFPFVTTKAFVCRMSADFYASSVETGDYEIYYGETMFRYYPDGTPNGISSVIFSFFREGDRNKYDLIGSLHDAYCEVWFLRPIKAFAPSITVKYGDQGAILNNWNYFDRLRALDDYINPRMETPQALTTIPAGVTASKESISIPAGTTGDFQYKLRATDDVLSPERAEVIVSFMYDADFTEEPTAFSDKWEVGDKVKTKDNRNATILNEDGDVITDAGEVVGHNSPNNPFYDSSKKTVTGTQTTYTPTEATETTTTKPGYTGDNAETAAIVNAVGDIGQGFTQSVNNLSDDITRCLNGLGQGNADGFNNLVNAIANLNNDANQNASQERQKIEEINDNLESIAEALAGDEGQEVDDVTISDETISAPTFSGFLSSIAGLNIAPASPPVFNVTLPRLGDLSPQILTLDFASIPFLHYFPLVRSILAWVLIIYTFKHIFQIFTGG